MNKNTAFATFCRVEKETVADSSDRHVCIPGEKLDGGGIETCADGRDGKEPGSREIWFELVTSKWAEIKSPDCQ